MAYPEVQGYCERIAGPLRLAGTVVRGNLIAHNGTNWVQADASDATTNLYAQYVALNSGESGQDIKGCKSCVLYDEDGGLTANATVYCSGTAGAITQTRPATNGDVIQIVGRRISTKRTKIDLEDPKEVEVFIPCPPYNQLSGGSAIEEFVVDGTTDEWTGADVDAAYVAGVFTSRFPSNIVGGVLAANLVVNTQASTALNIDVDVVACYDNDSNTGDAGASKDALTSAVTTADNQIHTVDISGAMDTDFVKPSRTFAVVVDVDGGDFILLGLYMRYLVV